MRGRAVGLHVLLDLSLRAVLGGLEAVRERARLPLGLAELLRHPLEVALLDPERELDRAEKLALEVLEGALRQAREEEQRAQSSFEQVHCFGSETDSVDWWENELVLTNSARSVELLDRTTKECSGLARE